MLNRWQKAGVIAQWLGLLAFVFAIIQIRDSTRSIEIQSDQLKLMATSISQQNKAIEKQHDWNRRNAAQQILNETTSKLSVLRERLLFGFPELFEEDNHHVLTKKEAKDLFYSCEKNPKGTGRLSCSARATASDMLNLLEMLSLGHEHQSIDTKMVEEAAGSLIVRFYNHFKALIEITRKERKNDTIWKPVEKFVKRYQQKNIIVAPVRIKTG